MPEPTESKKSADIFVQSDAIKLGNTQRLVSPGMDGAVTSRGAGVGANSLGQEFASKRRDVKAQGGSIGPINGAKLYAQSLIANQRMKAPHAGAEPAHQAIEKIRFQVNVRDNSVSSNEGTSQPLNQLGTMLVRPEFTAESMGGTLEPNQAESSPERLNAEVQRIDRLKAGFNVSYDSNSFQGIKNNLFKQTKAGQNADLEVDASNNEPAGTLH